MYILSYLQRVNHFLFSCFRKKIWTAVCVSLCVGCFTFQSFGQFAADFTADVQMGCGPLAVAFEDLSTQYCPGPECALTDWYWEFGDGGFSEEQNPIHIYYYPGTYDVTLTVWDVGGYYTMKTQTGFVEVYSCDLGWTYANGFGYSGLTRDPVSTATGEFLFMHDDLTLGGPMPLVFSKFYGSLISQDGYVSSKLGTNWMHNFEQTLIVDGDTITAVMYLGRAIGFEKDQGVWALTSPEPEIFQLIESDGKYILMDPYRNVMMTFDGSGVLQSIMDRNGNTHTLTYSSGFLTQVSDGLGRTLDFQYQSGKLVSVTDHGGRSLLFAYNGDNLISWTDAKGNTTEYAYTVQGDALALITQTTQPEGNDINTQIYDTEGKVTSQKDGLNKTTEVSYDSPTEKNTTVTDPLGNSMVHNHPDGMFLTEVTDKNEKMLSLSYDSNHRRNSLTDRMGDTTSIGYHEASGKFNYLEDAMGNIHQVTYDMQEYLGFTFYDPVKIDYPDGTSVAFTRDVAGNVLTKTNQLGDTWTYTYNGFGQTQSVTNPLGAVTSYNYDEAGNLISIADHFGNDTSFQYDEFSRLTRKNNPDATYKTYTYDDNDNLTSLTNANGNTGTISYDMNNMPILFTDLAGSTMECAYNGNNEVTSVVDRLGKTTTFGYDNAGNPQKITCPVGNIMTLSYDNNTWITGMSDPSGASGIIEYDDEGVIVSKTNAQGDEWNYFSDKLGRVTSIITPEGNTYSAEYNDQYRLGKSMNPMFREVSHTYDGRGMLESSIIPNDIEVSFQRNALGKAEVITDANGHDWNSEYDPLGRLISKTDPNGNVTDIEYDSRHRVSRTIFPESSMDVDYDPTGNIVSKTFSDGTTLTYTYDVLGRLVDTNNLSLGYNARSDITSCNGIDFNVDDAGFVTSVRFAAGKTITYSYDSRGLVYKISDWRGGNTFISYDELGRLFSITRGNGVVTYYTYSPDGWLASVSETGSSNISTITLHRDGAGNILSADRDIPQTVQMEKGSSEFTYDDASQITQYSYDKMGRLTSDTIRTYSWNLAEQMTGYSDGSDTASMEYNGLGLMTSQTKGGDTLEFVWNYVFDIPVVSKTVLNGTFNTYYVHLPSGELLYAIDGSDYSRKYYHYDEAGSTVCLTDDSGNVTDSYATTPFGMVISETGETDNPFVFLGKYSVIRDSGTGIYCMKTRYYDSNSGHFLSREMKWPDVKTPMGLNTYQYAYNNPLKYIDPSGMEPQPVDSVCVIEPYGQGFFYCGEQWNRESLFKHVYPLWGDYMYVGCGMGDVSSPGPFDSSRDFPEPIKPMGNFSGPGMAVSTTTFDVPDALGPSKDAVNMIAGIGEELFKSKQAKMLKGLFEKGIPFPYFKYLGYGKVAKGFSAAGKGCGVLGLLTIEQTMAEERAYAKSLGLSDTEAEVRAIIKTFGSSLTGPGLIEALNGFEALYEGNPAAFSQYDKKMEENFFFGWSHRLGKNAANALEATSFYDYAQYIFLPFM